MGLHGIELNGTGTYARLRAREELRAPAKAAARKFRTQISVLVLGVAIGAHQGTVARARGPAGARMNRAYRYAVGGRG
ncbi:hypothetical protein OG216_28770 [Streptomycetaceae bacterium NBC_01309]